MAKEMSSCRFTIAYIGDDVEQGTMSVQDVAPALLAVGSLFNAANDILNKESASVDVRITATEHASFGVELELIQSFYEQVVGMFSSDTATAALQLKEYIFGSVLGLAALIKWLRGRTIKQVDQTNKGNVTISVEGDHNTIIVSKKVLSLHENPQVRRALSTLVAPVQKEGIDGFEVRADGEVEQHISKEDARYFDSSMMDEEALVENVSRIAYTIVSLSFKSGNKWRLYDGQATVSVAIEDADFLERVKSGNESFVVNDILICQVRIRQTAQGSKGLRTTYTVERVLEHKRGQEQKSMGLE